MGREGGGGGRKFRAGSGDREIPEATVQAGPAMQRLPWSGCFASSRLGLVAPTPGQRYGGPTLHWGPPWRMTCAPQRSLKTRFFS